MEITAARFQQLKRFDSQNIGNVIRQTLKSKFDFLLNWHPKYSESNRNIGLSYSIITENLKEKGYSYAALSP